MWDPKTACQEIKDCPSNYKDDQGCKNALETCYYYHCDNYKVNPILSRSLSNIYIPYGTACGASSYVIMCKLVALQLPR